MEENRVKRGKRKREFVSKQKLSLWGKCKMYPHQTKSWTQGPCEIKLRRHKIPLLEVDFQNNHAWSVPLLCKRWSLPTSFRSVCSAKVSKRVEKFDSLTAEHQNLQDKSQDPTRKVISSTTMAPLGITAPIWISLEFQISSPFLGFPSRWKPEGVLQCHTLLQEWQLLIVTNFGWRIRHKLPIDLGFWQSSQKTFQVITNPLIGPYPVD